MCGDYDSVIGMKKDSSVARMVTKVPGDRFAPAEGEGHGMRHISSKRTSTGCAARIEAIQDRAEACQHGA